LPERIGARYVVSALLGRGGMGRVYRVTDTGSGREVALKQLFLPAQDSARNEISALFEREFHTLAQLSHPRVIEVYDYGLDEKGPYYTMELLDGGDLRSLSPLPWREACALLFDVCSSLALLHSRRLVHRDVSPRNVRCTRDGQAKLIDFGAMVPMGAGGQIVGTPSFVAPEVVHRSTLDARTDLFSLGATLYYALTGRSAYHAREFADLIGVWSLKPSPPSAIAPEVPAELDALVLSLVSVEPALRPRSAFDVMQRLAAIADLERDEPLSVAQAYLSTPTMVGRERMFSVLRKRMARSVRGRGRGVLIEGRSGLGCSRMLDACVLEAKTLGATVLRASADSTSNASFAVAQTLAEQMLQALPGPAWESAQAEGVTETLLVGTKETGLALRTLAGAGVAAMQIQIALAKWVLAISKQYPITIAVDDVHRIDEPSAGLLAALADKARYRKLLLALTAETGAPETSPALEVLAASCVHWKLAPLKRAQTEQLLGSVFGDVPNLGLISEGIHTVAAGNPRLAMDLAQHLVDKGLIRYDQGSWTLPSQLDPADLPSSAEEAMRTRIAALGPLARFLAEAHALAVHDGFARQDYTLLCPDAAGTMVDGALSELLAHGVLGSDGRLYVLSHRGWAAALLAELDQDTLRARHCALALLHEHEGGLLAVHHLLEGGLAARGLDLLAKLVEGVDDQRDLVVISQGDPARFAPMFERALDAALALKRPPREIHRLRRWLCSLSVISDDGYFWRAGPAWLAQLIEDSGLRSLRESTESDPNQRLMAALTAAKQRYDAAAEDERVYRPDQAIRLLVQYVAIAIVIGSWALDAKLLRSLPGLLAPFSALSPAIDALLQNAHATIETLCDLKPERARERWRVEFERLRAMTPAELPNVDLIRNAVAYGVGTIEARLGLATAKSWVEVLDADMLQRVNAMYLRRIIYLQQGDWDEADRFRRRAEVLALQTPSRPMFSVAPLLELASHAFAGHLGGLKQTADRIEVHAAHHAGWLPYRELAEALFQRQRGDLEAACAAFERCLTLTQPDPSDEERGLLAWPTAIASYVETLIALGRADEARTHARRALEICGERGIELAAHDIVRALALAEARAGEHAAAIARIDRLLAAQTALGIAGLHLGASYEVRARIAIWANDRDAFLQYARLAAREYHHGAGSPLGVRYERLLDEARRAGLRVRSEPVPHPAGVSASAGPTRSESIVALVTRTLRESPTAAERARRSLQLLCGAHSASVGYLFLFGENGLALAASQSSEPTPDGLREYLLEYLAHEHEDLSTTTAIVTSPSRPSITSKPHWTDPEGLIYRPIVLTCTVEQKTRHAGIAALVTGVQRSWQAVQPQLAAALAELLIEVGDATGLWVPHSTPLTSR
jgi:tetratricopeptide (TPR) repeat protein